MVDAGADTRRGDPAESWVVSRERSRQSAVGSRQKELIVVTIVPFYGLRTTDYGLPTHDSRLNGRKVPSAARGTGCAATTASRFKGP